MIAGIVTSSLFAMAYLLLLADVILGSREKKKSRESKTRESKDFREWERELAS